MGVELIDKNSVEDKLLKTIGNGFKWMRLKSFFGSGIMD
jgi:hypothetical protein